MSRHTKIALVTNGLYTSGGVSSVCWFLYQMISSVECYGVQLFSLETAYNHPINVRLSSPRSWFRGIQIEEISWHNIPTKHVGACFSEFEFQRYMPRKELNGLLNQFDLIQVVSGSPALAYVSKDIDVPVCLFSATMIDLERKSMLRQSSWLRRIYNFIMLPIVSELDKRAFRHIDHVFAETEYTRQALLPYTDASEVSIDSIGVDIHLFHPIPEKQRSDDYFLSVGRFEDVRKNVALLIEAYAVLRQRLPDAPRLILAGQTGPAPAVWARARALGITEHIEIKKDVTSDELIELYQNAAVYVLSSDEEGLGIVLLESMACATPVISTKCGGPDSIISDQVGFLIPVGDAQALTDKLHWMLRNPKQRRSMGLAGRQMVETRFSNEVVGKKYLDVYDRLLG